MLFRFVCNIDDTPIVFLLPSAIIGILLFTLSLFVAVTSEELIYKPIRFYNYWPILWLIDLVLLSTVK